ncbi:MAG: DUF2249 domain-containing protein [Brevibacterium sp.]|nr:DUF2249 domain-containing protein [Brevibacterium sp.]MDN6158782.1 DUF2249 domain-containing protein [Brevibacterium sp.]MDN6747744.1 DUF2249 domain-containing protein [Brevibacterium sp.]
MDEVGDSGQRALADLRGTVGESDLQREVLAGLCLRQGCTVFAGKLEADGGRGFLRAGDDELSLHVTGAHLEASVEVALRLEPRSRHVPVDRGPDIDGLRGRGIAGLRGRGIAGLRGRGIAENLGDGGEEVFIDDGMRAEAIARAARSVFDLHADNVAAGLVPLLAGEPSVSLADLRAQVSKDAGMNNADATTGTAASEPGGDHGHSCACGDGMVFVAPHDPLPLLAQIEGQFF